MSNSIVEHYQSLISGLIIGASEAKPLSSGWCENRKFGYVSFNFHIWAVSRLWSRGTNICLTIAQ